MTTCLEASRTPEGWYPDPDGHGLRYFDGFRWTFKTLEAQTAPTHTAQSLRAPAPMTTKVPLVAVAPQPLRKPSRRRSATKTKSPSISRGAWVADRLGFVLLIVGLTASLYFGWTLFGSNVYTDYRQKELAAGLAPTPPAAPQAPAVAIGMPGVGTTSGRIIIPKLGVDSVIVVGTSREDLMSGPGIWLDGVMPGMPGNATVSGHRTTYGAPFRHIDELVPGDQIIVQIQGQPDAVFEVRGSAIVAPEQVSVTNQTPGVRLTLTTCEPVGSDAQRLVVQSELVTGAFADQAAPASAWQFQS